MVHRTIPPVSQQTPLARDKRRSCGSSEHSEPGESTSLSNCPLFPTNALGAEGVTVGNEHTRTKTNTTELCSSILVVSESASGSIQGTQCQDHPNKQQSARERTSQARRGTQQSRTQRDTCKSRSLGRRPVAVLGSVPLRLTRRPSRWELERDARGQ